jgi:sugar lactone lactonase YvrE
MFRGSSFALFPVLITALIFLGCTNAYEPEDLGAPSPGNSGVISITQVDTNSLTVTWGTATDEVTPDADIEYKAVQSQSDNIAGVNSANANGSTVLDWSADTTEITVTGLNSGTQYYYNVLTRDTDGNVASYVMQSVETASADTGPHPDDLGAPAPGNSGVLTITQVDTSSLTITWGTATDEVTPSAEIEYKVVQSQSDNIAGVNSANANGSIVLDWSADTTEVAVTGLNSDTQYFYNVLTRDTDGNVASYVMQSVETASADTGPKMVQKLFWSDFETQEIYSINTDSTDLDTVISNSNYILSGFNYLTFHEASQQLFIAERTTGEVVLRMTPDGRQIQDISQGLSTPSPGALEIDSHTGRLYVYDFNSNVVKRMNLDGSAPEDYSISSLTEAFSLAIDEQNRDLYWTDLSDSTLNSVTLDRTNAQVLISKSDPNVTYPVGLTVDPQNGKLYFTDLGEQAIYRANLDGSNVEQIVADPQYVESPTTIVVDTEAQKLYWTNQGTGFFGGGSIGSSNTDGTSPELLIDVSGSTNNSLYGLTIGMVQQ